MHFVVKKKLEICANAGEFGSLCKSIFKAGLAPFGLALTPNISLVIINLILQGVGNGSQPLMSKYYGEKRTNDLTEAKHMAYTFAIILTFIEPVLMLVLMLILPPLSGG